MLHKPHKKNRSTEYSRFQRHRSIEHKLNIVRHIWLNNEISDKQKGKFAKGKVHCSCPTCSTKENVHGPKWSIVKKMESMKTELEDYDLE